MHKIPTLFRRNDDDHLVRDEVTPGCEWVLAGEGRPTRKFDGWACMVRGGWLFKRREYREDATIPGEFEPSGGIDPIAGKIYGWLPVGDGPDEKWHRAATLYGLADGTYELCGPSVQGNPEGFSRHVLIRHGSFLLDVNPRTYEDIGRYFAQAPPIEGIVWHHPDGRMAKIKVKDFGFLRVKGGVG